MRACVCVCVVAHRGVDQSVRCQASCAESQHAWLDAEIRVDARAEAHSNAAHLVRMRRATAGASDHSEQKRSGATLR